MDKLALDPETISDTIGVLLKYQDDIARIATGEGRRILDEDSRLADNIVYFARTLRKAGLRVGPAAVKDAIEAVLAGGIGSRDDFYWTLHSVLVTRREDHATFDEAF
eukprot:gene29467-36107_t